MTKYILLIIISVFTVIISVALFYKFQKFKPTFVDKLAIPSIDKELVTPKYVGIFLSSSLEKNKQIPVLILITSGGSGCDSVSDLKTKKSFSENKLVVDIEGYKFTKGPVGMICPAVMLDSKTKINLDDNWLKKNWLKNLFNINSDKEIIFRLNGQENKYKISYSQYRVTMSRIKATNVLINADISMTSEIILYPMDVAVMYLAGSVSSNKDYRMQMNSFAKSKGLIPIEQVYFGLQQPDKDSLYVVVKNRLMPELNRADSLGELPNERGVNVYLKRIVSEDNY